MSLKFNPVTGNLNVVDKLEADQSPTFAGLTITQDLNIGDIRKKGSSEVHVKGDESGIDNPGLLVLYDHLGNGYYLWVDHNGMLRLHQEPPVDEGADGVIVGQQPI